MAAFVGKKFRVSTIEGDVFEGTLHSLDVNNKKISLMKVCLVPSGKKLTGLLHFYGQEIHKLNEVSEDENVQAEKTKNKPHPHKDNDYEPEDEDSDAHTTQTTEYVYLRRLGLRFKQAIDQIKSQQLIGIASETESLSRRSKLSLLQICCANQVYIFDILSLGPVVFSQGLADILESPAIVKVIHDSRWTSDQLYHQYSVKLTNVYDTMAADVLIRMRRLNGELPHKLSSLTQCLLEYLDMSVTSLYPRLLHDQAKTMSESSLWMERPLSSKLLSQAAFNVRHLPDLRVRTLDHLLAEFTASVGVFLSCVRDMSDMNRGKANVSSSVVPRQLERLVYGDLPSTNPPVTNHSTVSTGLDPIKTEASVPLAKTEKLQHSNSRASGESTAKARSHDPPPSTSLEPHPSTNNTEQFCIPKMAIPKDVSVTTSNISQPRFTNGHRQYSERESPKKKAVGERRGTTKEYTTVVLSPSFDGRPVVKLAPDVADPKEAVPSTESENTEGFFDTSLVSKKYEEAIPRLTKDVTTLSLHGEWKHGHDDGGGCGKVGVDVEPQEDTSDKVSEETKNENSDDENCTDSDDDDEEEEEEECKEQDDPLDKTSTNHDPVLISQTEQAKHLSLSPHQRLRNLTPKMSSSAKNLPPNYLSLRGAIPTHETKKVEKSGSRLYSRVLNDAGLKKKLNIASKTQFPELDSVIHENSKKTHSSSGDEGGYTESPGQGAIPKRPTLHSLYSKEPATVTEAEEDAVTGGKGLSNTRMTKPSVGRGRAMTLSCYEDMRRSIHRPLELHMNSTANRDGKYDFPSQEELARVPKMPLQRASSYHMVPDAV